MKNNISIIVAVAQNGVIGGNNTLLWHISEDLKHFKAVTMGAPVIMGRKTYESIGRPLPGRDNVVISHQKDLRINGCEVVSSLREALTLTKTAPEVFIIGGASIYRQALEEKLADRIYYTAVGEEYEGDVSFPPIDSTQWEEIEREDFSNGENYPHPFSFIVYQRKK